MSASVQPARRRRVLLVGVAAVTAVSLVTPGASPVAAAVYRDAKAPVATRVDDLLRRMSVQEKVGQLQQIALTRVQGDCLWSGGELNTDCLRQVLVDDAVGSLLSGGGMAPARNTPRDWAVMTNTLQRYAIEHSRLHIPIVYGIDAVHGHNNVLGATMFPHQLGLGATWDTELVTDTNRSTQRALAATGTTWNFAPVADVARDPRWGRYYETYAEDPVLAAGLTAGAVVGIQDTSSGRPVAATVKHFAGYSEPVNGHDRVPADLSTRYLQDMIFPPYRAGIEAGADTVMVNSGAVNGVPAHASRYLLTDVLRARWRFDGLIVSDWNDVRNLHTAYHVAVDYPSAIAMAINAGVDMAMLPPDDRSFHDSAVTAVRRGLISGRRLDQAVGRVLRLKFELGLFDNPYVEPDQADAAVRDPQLSRRAATESMVLLRNEGNLLPFGAGTRRIVVTGPSADSMPRQLGGWSIGWQGVPDGVDVPGTTVLEGLRAGAPAGTEISYAPAASDAVARTRGADAAVVVVGEPPGAEGQADNPRPALAEDQLALVRALRDTGRPVVVVVLAGRPLVLGDAGGTAGLLMAWLPGTEGGDAVADVLFGKANPSGRLPVSWPRALGNEPQPYTQLPGPYTVPGATYDPAFPFGAGLSYTTHMFGALTAARGRDQVTVEVTVANTGSRAGDLVVPVYVSQPVSPVLVPPRRLAAFTRVGLNPGQSRTVRLSVPFVRLALTPGDVDGSGQPRVAPGTYRFTAGESFADVTL